MKKLIALIMFFNFTILVNAQVKVNQNAANSSINTSSAFMDASSSSIWNASANQGKGMLFPRVNLVNFSAMSHAGPFNASNNPNYFDGLLVYNIATGIAPIGGDSVFPGYYYYRNTTTTANGGRWFSLKGLENNPIIEVADEFIATAAQTSFTLSQSPDANCKVKMYINGIRISNAAYIVSGTTLTYISANNGAFTLVAGDRVQLDYYK